MEKKVPEKNVTMKQEDIFYVYEKRINKCVRRGCEGVVKYGLVLKVDTGHDETINCYECNKCHMKYTPYPNYNRLEDKNLSAIYNIREVSAWQEHTKRKIELRANPDAGSAGLTFKNLRIRLKAEQEQAKKRTLEKKAKKKEKPQMVTEKKGKIIITRTMESCQKSGMQMKKKKFGPRNNPNM